jgi:hypothetical protein
MAIKVDAITVCHENYCIRFHAPVINKRYRLSAGEIVVLRLNKGRYNPRHGSVENHRWRLPNDVP